MNLLLQPPGSRLCGQYCVAMVAGVEPEAAITAFGSRGPTRPQAVVNALRHFGLRVSPQLCRVTQQRPLPALGLLKLARPKQAAFHWVLLTGGIIYCPLLGIVPFEDYPQGHNGFKFTSFLEIFEARSPLVAEVASTPTPL
jgi:hypothetical protein